MARAIVEIDMPEQCSECPLERESYCMAVGEELPFYGKRATWCPLKESVKPKPVLHNDFRCPACGNNLYCGQAYCDECGRKVKWDG